MNDVSKSSQECELFRENLQRILDERGISKSELATQAGIHRQTIYKILNGEMSPAYDISCRIADALQVELQYFRQAQKIGA